MVIIEVYPCGATCIKSNGQHFLSQVPASIFVCSVHRTESLTVVCAIAQETSTFAILLSF